MRSIVVIATLLVGAVAHLAPMPEVKFAYAQAESSASKADVEGLKKDVEGLKATVENLERQLDVIRQLLLQRQAQPQPQRPPVPAVTVRVDGSPMLGSAGAPLTVVEFSDYQCPACRVFVEQTFPALKAEYIDTGKVRYAVRDFPIDSIHRHARKAAEAARCAGDQGKYWEMHDLLWKNQSTLTVEHLKTHARSLGLNPAAFDDCLGKDHYAAAVEKDLQDGVAAGIRGTPSFFIGKTRADGTIQGTLLRGAHPITAFRQAIDRLLAEQ